MHMSLAEDTAVVTASKPAVFQFRVREDQGLPCWIARPESPDPQSVPLVAVHGLHRGARLQAVLLGDLAARTGRTVVAPLFDADRWPKYQQVVRRGRADLALLRLLGDLRALGLVPTGKFDLFGYSAGGQFAHRFAMLYPHKLRRLSIAAAGWYTFPDEYQYPYGQSPEGRFGQWGAAMAAGMDVFLGLDIRVFVGADDCHRDANTRTSPELDAQQGLNRMERARRWVDALRHKAEDQGHAPRISLTILQGCGHSFEDCMRTGGMGRLIFSPYKDQLPASSPIRERRP